MTKKSSLRQAMQERILLLDGAMGSLIQEYQLSEDDFRGQRFSSWGVQVKGNNDVLSLTRPDVVRDIYRKYLEAGSDVISTNTFNAQRISQHEYQMADYAMEMNRVAATLACEEADRMTALTPDRPRFVLGDVGPTNKMLSMSDDVNDPAARSITFDELESVYYDQIRVLLEAGVDGILIETIFDTLNAKAALSAFQKAKDDLVAERGGWEGAEPEVLLSMTVSDASGRTLSGQTIEAFVISVSHAHPLSVGLNCGLGADGMLPYLQQMNGCAPCFVSCHPNAGLPNQFGGYDDTPADMHRQMQAFLDQRLVNMIGGCCGTTPAHIAEMRRMLDADDTLHRQRREVPELEPRLRLAGLEPSVFDRSVFVKVGERCNVAGSRKFLKLINEKKYDEALEIARKQVEDGAMAIDVNMDDGLLDAREEMQTFLNLLASDPAICRVPIMVDSSRFEVIEAGLKCAQGKCIVNSISLKLGEADFLEHARVVKRLGAALIVMCFDEEGQATDYASRVRICQRAYRLLLDEVGFDPNDIIFDPNVLTIATGMAEHNAYAIDFIRATRWITDNLPGARVSGGLSNLSFAFRGNNYLREAMHSVFLHSAIAEGMGMAIMNPAAEVKYDTIKPELVKQIEDVVLNVYPEAGERLIETAQEMLAAREAEKKAKEAAAQAASQPNAALLTSFRSAADALLEAGSLLTAGTMDAAKAGAAMTAAGKAMQDLAAAIESGNFKSGVVARRAAVAPSESAAPAVATPEQRLVEALIKGSSSGIDEDLMTLIHRGDAPIQIISGPLMEGMNRVGELFGEGKMFLPQVVKTARTMKKAVEVLQPYFSSSGGGEINYVGRILNATVKGDVHDIGKNIVGVVLACNNFEVIDLGVMVPTELIVQTAIERKVDVVCLSGLITPSLEEMCHVAQQMQEAGLRIPIFVGGATTSPMHTAVKIAPLYEGGVFHLRDASQNPVLALKLLDPQQRDEVIEANRREQERLRQSQQQKQEVDRVKQEAAEALGVQTPLERRHLTDWASYQRPVAPFEGQQQVQSIRVSELIPLIDWLYFYWAWRVKEESHEGQQLKADALRLLASMADDPDYDMRAVTAFYAAEGADDHILVHLRHSDHDPQCPCCNRSVALPTPRQQKAAPAECLSLCDYVAPSDDHIGLFAATVSQRFVDRLETLKSSKADDYESLLLQTVGDRLAEAASEYLHRQLTALTGWKGIRPAVGYPSLPDQKSIFTLASMLDFSSVGISLTENGAMYPQASVSGIYVGHPEADYFTI